MCPARVNLNTCKEKEQAYLLFDLSELPFISMKCQNQVKFITNTKSGEEYLPCQLSIA